MADIEALVDRIYEAAVEPDLWPSVLHDLAHSVDAVSGVLLTARNDSWLGWRVSIDTPRGADEYLRSQAAAQSQSTARLMGIGRAGFVADHELFGDDEFLADPLMTHWGDPVGLHRTAATAIRMPTGDFVVVHVQRRKGLPKLDEGDLARLNAFRPHLARAGMLAARWRMQRLQAAAEALALVGLPAAVLDFNGRVLAANDLLEDKSSWLAWLPGDRLALLDLPANNLLTRALTELRDPVMASVRSIPIRAKGGASAAVVHLVPVTGRARDIFDGAYGILVMTPCSTTTSPVDGILEALFDLTPAEAKVASRIADGLSLDQIAVQHHVAIDTIRAQCKAVFAKTGTNRQAQVASLLAGIPRLPRGRSSG